LHGQAFFRRGFPHHAGYCQPDARIRLDLIFEKELYLEMAEETSEKQHPSSSDEVALDMMKFIAVTTGYGRGTPTTGFGGKGPRSAEEYADALLELFERCRSVVRKNSK
jgi:hypothetical protein